MKPVTALAGVGPHPKTASVLVGVIPILKAVLSALAFAPELLKMSHPLIVTAQMGLRSTNQNLSEFLLGVNEIDVHHGVSQVFVSKGKLDEPDVAGPLVEFYRKGMPQGVELFAVWRKLVPDLVKSGVTEVEGLITFEPLDGGE